MLPKTFSMVIDYCTVLQRVVKGAGVVHKSEFERKINVKLTNLLDYKAQYN